MLKRQLERREKQYQEHVELLELQVKAHRDDWEAEHTEKQQALKLKEAAEQQVHDLSLKLKVNNSYFKEIL